MSTAAYDALAPFYDAFQSRERPEGWAAFLQKTLQEHLQGNPWAEPQGDKGSCLAVDLGCGTGLVTQALLDQGLDVIGIDTSEQMLAEAWERAFAAPTERRPLYLAQDITAFELYGTVNLIYTSLDTFNHLTFAELEQCLRLCLNYLHPGGLLIFDLLSLDYMAEEMGEQFYYEVEEDYALLWSNHFSAEEKSNRATLTIFSRRDEGALYERQEAEITEYYHAPPKVLDLLRRLGFTADEMMLSADEEAALGVSRRHFIKASIGPKPAVPGQNTEPETFGRP